MDWTAICDYCIKVMRSGSAVFGVTYGFINVFLFVILQPLAILSMFVAYILQRQKKPKSALTFCILGLAMVLFIVVCVLISCYKMK